MQPLIIKGEMIVMKTGIVLILLVFGQFAYADDRLCQIVNLTTRDRITTEINDYVLEQCQDGDVLYIRGANHSYAARTYCKLETIVFYEDVTGVEVLCEYRKEAREFIRPSNKEWKQMKKNSKKLLKHMSKLRKNTWRLRHETLFKIW